MSRTELARWIAAYELAWRTPGTAALAELFAPDATYSAAPFDDPLRGLAAIRAFWESERDGPDEDFVLVSELVAVDATVGVARIEVRYGDPVARTYRDLWVVSLDSDGRCTAFEEWPFFPGRPRVAS
ncbi:MAG TPA: nuclear transport factor 2 family protein [Solirubrobacteraceae bacterium]